MEVFGGDSVSPQSRCFRDVYGDDVMFKSISKPKYLQDFHPDVMYHYKWTSIWSPFPTYRPPTEPGAAVGKDPLCIELTTEKASKPENFGTWACTLNIDAQV